MSPIVCSIRKEGREGETDQYVASSARSIEKADSAIGTKHKEEKWKRKEKRVPVRPESTKFCLFDTILKKFGNFSKDRLKDDGIAAYPEPLS